MVGAVRRVRGAMVREHLAQDSDGVAGGDDRDVSQPVRGEAEAQWSRVHSSFEPRRIRDVVVHAPDANAGRKQKGLASDHQRDPER